LDVIWGWKQKKSSKKIKIGNFKAFSKKGNSPYFYDELFLPCMTMSKNTTFFAAFWSEIGWI